MTKPMEKAKPKRLSRLQIMLSADELTALDNFRFEKRMPSLAAAIREILRRGLTVDGFTLADKGRSSSAFGVLESDDRLRSAAAATEEVIEKVRERRMPVRADRRKAGGVNSSRRLGTQRAPVEK